MTDPCVHIWNAHRQCQWCKRDRKDVEYDEMKVELTRLRALLEPCRADTDAQTDASYPKTVDDVLSLLSAYVCDFMPAEAVPGDEYFGAWERQARRVIQPLMQERDKEANLRAAIEIGHQSLSEDNTRLRGLLVDAIEVAEYDDEYDEWHGSEIPSEWFDAAKAALEGKP